MNVCPKCFVRSISTFVMAMRLNYAASMQENRQAGKSSTPQIYHLVDASPPVPPVQP